MKANKYLCATAMAMSLAFASAVPAFASTPTGGLTLDPAITINGLQENDEVSFYKVVRWNNGWTIDGTGFNLTDAEVAKMIGTASTPGEIDSALAGKIGGLVSGATTSYTGIKANASGTATKTGPDAGLYVAIIKPANSGYLYNPVFVAADYQTDNNTENGKHMTFSSSWDVNTSLSYADGGVAKKQELTVTKTADDAKSNDSSQAYEYDSDTVHVGDTLTYTINTTIPEFADDYTAPVFKVTDKLSSGLTLDFSSVNLVAPTGLHKGDDLSASGTDYTLTQTSDGFVIQFSPTYLRNLSAATNVQIMYNAVVNSAALAAVNTEDNTVTLNYSNEPSDTTGNGSLKDKTMHYTFDIDANLLGETNYKNSEVVKIGVDKDGNEITKETTLANGASIGALEGAEFKLYTAYTSDTNNTPFTNKYFTADTVIVSDSEGRLKVKGASEAGIRGLDAGTYYLVETKAPDGYIKASDPVTIVITPTFETKTATEGGVTYSWEELVSYTVTINNAETAEYTMTNGAANNGDQNGDNKISTNDANSGKIKNTQGVALPSTGGMGTRILYAIGGGMILVAGVYLVTKKRLEHTEME